jgi:AcrR family transcriptional regulator
MVLNASRGDEQQVTNDTIEHDHIVRVADQLFYERGIHAVGMDAIRTAAGVPLKRLYAEFASKDALLAEVLHYRSGIWDAGIAAAAAAARSCWRSTTSSTTGSEPRTSADVGSSTLSVK